MGLYKYIRKVWAKPKVGLGPEWQARLIKWRRQPSTIRLERPTRLDRARTIGYRAKPGVIIIRQRVIRGGRMRENNLGGRRPRHNVRRKVVDKNYRQIAEERANKKYPNCEVLNSYPVVKDGRYYWFEVILVDRSNPSVLKDKNLNFVARKNNRGRVFRGLTSAGRKARGLRHKGKGAEHLRPSKKANLKRRNKI